MKRLKSSSYMMIAISILIVFSGILRLIQGQMIAASILFLCSILCIAKAFTENGKLQRLRNVLAVRGRTALIAVFVVFAVVMPFIMHDFTFRFLKDVSYWITIAPISLMIPIFITSLRFEEQDRQQKR